MLNLNVIMNIFIRSCRNPRKMANDPHEASGGKSLKIRRKIEHILNPHIFRRGQIFSGVFA